MSGKFHKKMRQLYRKDVKPLVQERVDMMTKHVVNGKPKYMPKWLWHKLVRIVLKV